MSKAKTILVIENNEVIMNVAKLTMQRMGVFKNVKFLRNGFEAIDYLTLIMEEGLLFPYSVYMDIDDEYMEGVEFLEFYSSLANVYSRNKSQIKPLNKLLLDENKSQIERNRIVNTNTIWSKGNKLNDLV
ncbi:MAG: response regulator [Flavobacteriales bacterium]|nr:response regulator [Flavobacteriales bacterium]